MTIPALVLVERALERLDRERARVHRWVDRTGDRVAGYARIARIAELEARWYRVLFEHTVERVYGRAVLDAEANAKRSAGVYRELAEFWRAHPTRADRVSGVECVA